MTEFALYLAVFVAGAVPMLEVWLAVPAGVAAGLPLLPTALVAIAGNFLTVAIVILAGDAVRGRLARRKRSGAAAEERADSRDLRRAGRIRRLTGRFGVPGLALLAPFVVGSHFGAIGAVATGAPKGVILAWFLLSLALQAFVMGALAVLGLSSLGAEAVLPWLG